MIQFWGTNIRQNTERVAIVGNQFHTGEGFSYQMIFGNNEHRAKNGWLFEDIRVEHNVVFGSNSHMISLGDTRNLAVRHNTVMINDDTMTLEDGGTLRDPFPGFVEVRNSKGQVVERNIAEAFRDPADERDNAVLTRSSVEPGGNVRDHVVNWSALGSGDLRDLTLRPDSPLNGTYGSRLTWFSETDGRPARRGPRGALHRRRVARGVRRGPDARRARLRGPGRGDVHLDLRRRHRADRPARRARLRRGRPARLQPRGGARGRLARPHRARHRDRAPPSPRPAHGERKGVGRLAQRDAAAGGRGRAPHGSRHPAARDGVQRHLCRDPARRGPCAGAPRLRHRPDARPRPRLVRHVPGDRARVRGQRDQGRRAERQAAHARHRGRLQDGHDGQGRVRGRRAAPPEHRLRR